MCRDKKSDLLFSLVGSLVVEWARTRVHFDLLDLLFIILFIFYIFYIFYCLKHCVRNVSGRGGIGKDTEILGKAPIALIEARGGGSGDLDPLIKYHISLLLYYYYYYYIICTVTQVEQKHESEMRRVGAESMSDFPWIGIFYLYLLSREIGEVF